MFGASRQFCCSKTVRRKEGHMKNFRILKLIGLLAVAAVAVGTALSVFHFITSVFLGVLAAGIAIGAFTGYKRLVRIGRTQPKELRR